MAKTNVPNPENSKPQDSKKREQVSRTRTKKHHQEMLTYERNFLKIKADLEKSAEETRLEEAIKKSKEEAEDRIKNAKLTIVNKTRLEEELRTIRMQHAAELARYEIQLVEERRRAEYTAHMQAVKNSQIAARSQDLYQRHQTATAIADAHKVQVERLKAAKELELRQLETQQSSLDIASPDYESQIAIIEARKAEISSEISSAQADLDKFQANVSELAERVATFEFNRMSSAGKLYKKQQELLQLQAEEQEGLIDLDQVSSELSKKRRERRELVKNGATEEDLQQVDDEIATLVAARKTLKDQQRNLQATIAALTTEVEQYQNQVTKDSRTRVVRRQQPPVENDSEHEDADEETVTTDEKVPKAPETVSGVDMSAQIESLLAGMIAVSDAFGAYAHELESRVVPESSTSETVLDTSPVEDTVRSTSGALVSQLRALVDQSVTGDIELRSDLNTKIDELNQVLTTSLDNPSKDSGKELESTVLDLVSEITSAVESARGETLPIVVNAPESTVPDVASNLQSSIDQVALLTGLLQIEDTLTTFFGAFENYVVDVRSKTVQSGSEAVSSVIPQTTVQDQSTALFQLLQQLVNGSNNLNDEHRKALADISSVLKSQSEMDDAVDFSSLVSLLESLSSEDSKDTSSDTLKELTKLMKSDPSKFFKSSHRNLFKNKDNEMATGQRTAAKQAVDQELEDKHAARLDQRIANLAVWEKRGRFFRSGESDYRKEVINEKLVGALQSTIDALADLSKSIDSNINEYFQYQAEINAKLQGLDLDYQGMLDTLTDNLGMSMLVSQKDYINKFKQLVDAGIAHNMETRAFLATVSDKVVNTFDAFDSNLLRLVRLQQQDSTSARLGLESSLNKLFNSTFSDSSYLSDGGPHDAVSAAILEASSMLSNDMSVEFEYMVHKWLGSLYSLGMSSDTLESIAKGLNYLGTGNVAALNSDQSLQTLLAMSAARGGESYAEILVNGLDADTTNNLLEGMITYLMEIATNTDNNQVTKSAYSDLFGMHVSDLRSIINMTENDISSLSNLTLTYSQAVNETQDQLSQIVNRTHLSTMVDNLFENAVLGASLDIGNNPVSYGLWKTLNIVEGLTGGIALPFVNVFGSGFDLNTTVTQLAKGGMAGLAMMGNLISALGSGGSDFGMSLDAWNNDTNMIARGDASKFLSKGSASGFSSSARLDYAGSGSSGDMKKTEMSDATDSAKEDSEVTNKHSQEEQSVPEKIYEQTQLIYGALAEDDNTLLKQSVATYTLLEDKLQSLGVLSQITTLLGPSRVFFTAGMDDLGVTAANIQQTRGVGNSTTISISDYENQLSTLQKVSSAFQTVITNSSDLIGANVDIWSLIDASSSLSASSLRSELKEQYSSTNEGFYNFNKYNQNTDVNTELVNKLATQIQTSSITEQELKQFAQLQQLNKIVFPEYVRATIDDLAPGVKKYTEELLKRAVEMSLYGTDIESRYEDPDNEMPIVKQMVTYMREMLSDPTTILNIRESRF